MTRVAHDVIKSVDPSAIIVSPAPTGENALRWFADFLSKGGGRYVDVVGYHLYVYPRPPEVLLPFIQKVKQTMTDNGAGDKPLWCTELGWAQPKPFPSDELGAAYLTRSFALAWSAGVKRLFWYAWDNHGWIALETTQADSQTLRPAGQAFGTIQKWMVGASMDGCDEYLPQTWTCHLHRGNKSQWIVWTVGSQPRTFQVPSAWNARSVTPLLGQPSSLKGYSIEIGQVPVLISTEDFGLATPKIP
jgi:hypothetical protein